MKTLRLFILLLLGSLTLSVMAQNSCDKLFTNGVKLQKTMTVASQNKAISFFEKAKICYDSKAKKDLCDQQIKACRNIISQLSKKTNKVNTSITPADTVVANPEKGENIESKKDLPDVELSIPTTYLKFKGKGGEFKKAKVICNYSDWTIIDKPDWVTCSKNENGEIIVEAEKNKQKDERSGLITIECKGKTATLTVIQEKNKKLGFL